MTTSVRLDTDLARELEILARREGSTKSALIVEGVRRILEERSAGLSPWELGKDLFGRHASPHKDLARNSKRYFKEKMLAKAQPH